MLKTIGFVLIFISGSGMGLRASYNLQLRLEQMKQIQGILLKIKGELRYSHQPMSMILNHIAKNTAAPFSCILEQISETLELHNGASMSEIWRQTIEEYKDKVYLRKGELQLLSEHGTILGYLDKELQMNQLDLQLVQWNRMIEQSELELQSNAKLYRSLGVMGSILTIIILL